MPFLANEKRCRSQINTSNAERPVDKNDSNLKKIKSVDALKTKRETFNTKSINAGNSASSKQLEPTKSGSILSIFGKKIFSKNNIPDRTDQNKEIISSANEKVVEEEIETDIKKYIACENSTYIHH